MIDLKQFGLSKKHAEELTENLQIYNNKYLELLLLREYQKYTYQKIGNLNGYNRNESRLIVQRGILFFESIIKIALNREGLECTHELIDNIKSTVYSFFFDLIELDEDVVDEIMQGSCPYSDLEFKHTHKEETFPVDENSFSDDELEYWFDEYDTVGGDEKIPERKLGQNINTDIGIISPNNPMTEQETDNHVDRLINLDRHIRVVERYRITRTS